MNRKIIIFTLTCIGLSFFAFSAWYKYGRFFGYSCTGNINFQKESAMFRLSSKLRLNRDKGTLNLNGVLIANDGARKNLNRTIYFNSVNETEHYTWTSVKITPSIDEKIEEKELQLWLPDFYVHPGGSIQLYINRLNFNSITISGELLPYLICTAKH